MKHVVENSSYMEATWVFLDRTTLPEEQLTFVHDRDSSKKNVNFKCREVNVPVKDIRSMEEQPTLQEHGFTVINNANTLSYEEFHDDEKVKEYAQKVKQKLKSLLRARAVYMHEMVVRSIDVPGNITRKTANIYSKIRKSQRLPDYGNPVHNSHIDYTPDSIKSNVASLAGLDAAELENERIQAINIWHPIRGPVKTAPLTLCDIRSVNQERDCKVLTDYQPDGTVVNYWVAHSPEQQWYYLSDQQPSEQFIFSSGDTSGQIVVPHASIKYPRKLEGDAERESIEMRAFVFY